MKTLNYTKGTSHHKFTSGRTTKPLQLPTWYGYRQEVSKHFGVSERTIDNWIIAMKPEVIKYMLKRYHEKMAEEMETQNNLKLFSEQRKS